MGRGRRGDGIEDELEDQSREAEKWGIGIKTAVVFLVKEGDTQLIASPQDSGFLKWL